MVQIVLSLDKEHEKKLRGIAMKEFDGKKGALSAIVEKGIDLVEQEVRQRDAHEKLMWLIKNKTGKAKEKWTFDRNEIYEDRIKRVLNRH